VKAPAVAIVAAFVCGITLGLYPPLAQFSTSAAKLIACFVTCALFAAVALWLLRSEKFVASASASLLCWFVLGVTSSAIAQQPLAANHVTQLLDHNHLSLKTPLRWHGILRDEPTHLPWGTGYEIDLGAVDYQSATMPVTGGLRLSFSPHSANDAALPLLHAGDTIDVITEARRPPFFRDEGAFDRRAYLATQNIDLIATLRSPKLLQKTSTAALHSQHTIRVQLAHIRASLRDELDSLLAGDPQSAATLRAMLLGDRTFIDRDESIAFQKTGVFHILVVAGLHVAALAALIFWTTRKLRLSPTLTIVIVVAALTAYVAVVEVRAPVLRATLMACAFVLGRFFYRRLDLLNSAALAALVILIARPLAVRDSSFQLTFVAIGCIAGLAIPWLDTTIQPYARAVRAWRDITRDAGFEPRAAQFRLDVRATLRWVASHSPNRAAAHIQNALAGTLAITFRISELLTLTLILQLGMLPLMAANFHRIALSSPAVNLAAVPLTSIIVPCGFLTLTAGLLWPLLGKLLAAPLALVTKLLITIVAWFAALPRWSYRIPTPPLWLTFLFFALAITIATIARLNNALQQKNRRLAIHVLLAAFIATALLVATFPFPPTHASARLESTILDVGQGDSILLVSPHGKSMLIDGGGAFRGFPGREDHTGTDPGEEAVSPYLWSRGFKKIDVVALTHAHQDHLGGLTAILENFKVGELWIGREVNSHALAAIEAVATQRGTRIKHEIRGQTFEWDGVEGQFLWPEIAATEIAPSAKNNDSLVLRLKFGDRTLLFPGDAEKAVERAMLSENDESTIHGDILKVGHHGSKNSTTPDFLSAVNPQLAIISSGEGNPYGHPSPEALTRLETAGVRTLRTDTNGAIHILTDGKQIEVTCFVACPAPAATGSAGVPPAVFSSAKATPQLSHHSHP
jgi:competence protein ComEC